MVLPEGISTITDENEAGGVRCVVTADYTARPGTGDQLHPDTDGAPTGAGLRDRDAGLRQETQVHVL